MSFSLYFNGIMLGALGTLVVVCLMRGDLLWALFDGAVVGLTLSNFVADAITELKKARC